MQSPFPLGFNGNIYHEGNISKMPAFDVFFFFWNIKRKSRSHGKRNDDNTNRKFVLKNRINTSLKDLTITLNNHGRHGFRLYHVSDLKGESADLLALICDV